jgi:hypothetical protein
MNPGFETLLAASADDRRDAFIATRRGEFPSPERANRS